MVVARQTTLRHSIHLQGVGVHSGQACSLTIHPADAGTGRTISRSDQDFGEIRATHPNVSAADLSTVIGDVRQGGVATVEHVLSALNGLGIDNAMIEVDGPEIPILDGSSAQIVEAIGEVGILTQHAARRFLKILKSVRVSNGSAYAELRPADKDFSVEVEIDFATPVIGHQKRKMMLEPQAYCEEVSGARTFGFMADVERLWANRMALGASLDNTVVVGDDRVMNPEGLRFGDEFVRHKILDAVGDLGLAGLPMIGAFKSYKGGHKLNIMVLEALFADPSNYKIIEAAMPARKRGHAEVNISMAAYKADAN